MKNLGLFFSIVFILGSILLSYYGFKNGKFFFSTFWHIRGCCFFNEYSKIRKEVGL